jgi:glucose/arabinose dehydrogenase
VNLSNLVQKCDADILARVNTTNLSRFGAAALAALISLGEVSAAEAGKGFSLKTFAEGFVSPTAMAPIPGTKKVIVADQAGVAYVVDEAGKRAEQPFLDVRPRLTKLTPGFDERGLIGFALHPKFSENKTFFVVYSAPKRSTAPESWDHTMVLSRFTANADGLTAKGDSEKVLLGIDKPFFNHNGGTILFGPDGYLYFATGDGGHRNDQDDKAKPRGRPPEGNAQNLQNHMGKILRIDVDKGETYSVPQDNPFVGKSAKPEIWAYGLRNPWRISFDRGGNHELFAADVGQDAFEEVNIIVKGGNYGWNIREGFHCFNPVDPKKPLAECPDHGANGDKLIDPILEYKNLNSRAPDAQGISITGGYVYRGKALPQWQGKYIFADWSRTWVKADGVLFAATKGSDGKWTWEKITPASHAAGMSFYITGFGEDAEGELYIFTNNSNSIVGSSGKVLKIVPM